jgi:amino acid transporter
MDAVDANHGLVAPAGNLKRALTAVTNGAITFAGVGVFGGLFSLYGFSMSGVGGSEFWGWPLVGISVGSMVLVFAELASKYPFAGSMYHSSP